MDLEIDKLAKTFAQRCAGDGPMPLYDAEVTEVNEDDFTCDILLDGLPLYDVRLRAIVSEKQSIDVLPKVGAQVVIGKLGDDDFLVIACDEITLHRVTIGTVVFKLNSDGVLISKGNETLNKILTDLVTGVLSVAAPKDVPGITALKIRINNLLK